MGKIIDVCEAWLKSDEWSYDRHPERDLIRTSVRGDDAAYQMFFNAKEDQEQLMVYVKSPNLVPEDKRAAAAEFVARANYGLIIGNFELDMSDGEIRYKVSVDVEGSKLVPLMVKNMIGAGVTMMNQYYPGIMAVSYGSKSPADAIKAIEEG